MLTIPDRRFILPLVEKTTFNTRESPGA